MTEMVDKEQLAASYTVHYYDVKLWLWISMILLINVINGFLPINQTVKYIVLGVVTLTSATIMIGYIRQLKKVRYLGVYSHCLKLDGQPLSSFELQRIHVLANGMIAVVKKQGNLLTRSQSILLKDRDDKSNVIDDLHRFCQVNGIEWKNEWL